jgi:hypothetical protein
MRCGELCRSQKTGGPISVMEHGPYGWALGKREEAGGQAESGVDVD